MQIPFWLRSITQHAPMYGHLNMQALDVVWPLLPSYYYLIAVQVLDIASGVWSDGPTMSVPRMSASSCILDDKAAGYVRSAHLCTEWCVHIH